VEPAAASALAESAGATTTAAVSIIDSERGGGSSVGPAVSIAGLESVETMPAAFGMAYK
jgi:hypothetical protein